MHPYTKSHHAGRTWLDFISTIAHQFSSTHDFKNFTEMQTLTTESQRISKCLNGIVKILKKIQEILKILKHWMISWIIFYSFNARFDTAFDDHHDIIIGLVHDRYFCITMSGVTVYCAVQSKEQVTGTNWQSLKSLRVTARWGEWVEWVECVECVEARRAQASRENY